MTRKDYMVIGMTVASTAVKLKPLASLGDITDIIDSWSIVLLDDNDRFDKEKFSKFVIDRWLVESR